MRFSLIGPGRVGLSFAHALRTANYELMGITARSMASAQQAAAYLGGGQALPAIDQTLCEADLIIIATPDDVIAPVAAQVAGHLAARRNRPAPEATTNLPVLVVHTSGAKSLDVLAPVAETGALVGSLHPLQTFARRWPPEPMAGCVVTVEAAGEALDRCLAVVHALQGQPLRLRPGTKAEYHAAASMVSNHLVGLIQLGLILLNRAGLEDEDGLRALLPLIRRTVENCRHGLDQALTGPIERGDVGTVQSHLSALARWADGSPGGSDILLQAYRALGLATLSVARRKHDNASYDEIESLLRAQNHIAYS